MQAILMTVCSEAAKVTPGNPAFDKANRPFGWHDQPRAKSSGSPIETDPVPRNPLLMILPEEGEDLNPRM
jgi:hypothetical protein